VALKLSLLVGDALGKYVFGQSLNAVDNVSAISDELGDSDLSCSSLS